MDASHLLDETIKRLVALREEAREGLDSLPPDDEAGRRLALARLNAFRDAIDEVGELRWAVGARR